MKKIIFISFFIFLLILCSCFNNKIVAKYKTGSLYLNEAVDRFNKMNDGEKKNYVNEDDYYKFIRNISLEKIILDKAYDEGLDSSNELNKRLEISKNDIAFRLIKKKNVIDKITIEKNDYNKYLKTYELYQIVKKVNKDEEKESTKQFLKKISGEIANLDKFKEYAAKYSDDITASNGGFVGNVRLGIMEEGIDNVIKNLGVNKISDVIESQAGYHIFYINRIEESKYEDLYKDKKIFDEIYEEKKSKLEEEWYNKLLKDSSLKINNELLKDQLKDDKIVIKYKNKKITRKEFFDKVDKYRQNSFPEPTYDDLISLAKSLALNLIIEDMCQDKKILKSKDFKKLLEDEKKFLIVNQYINTHLTVPEIDDKIITDFYNKNLNTLFTFSLENGKKYVQPIEEVKDFIKQKMETIFIQESKKNLFQKLIKDADLNIDKEVVKLFIEKINKSKNG